MISQEYGALCLAETSNDPLLWAHYADGHRGFAIGFDSGNSWFRLAANPHDPLLDEIQPVTYQSDRPVVPMIDPFEWSQDVMRLQLRGMLFTKHNSWQHEAEWRLVRPLASATQAVKAPAGKVIHLFAYPAEAVCEVIVGARASESLKAEIVNLLATPPFKRVCLRRAAVSRSSYLLNLDDCSGCS